MKIKFILILIFGYMPFVSADLRFNHKTKRFHTTVNPKNVNFQNEYHNLVLKSVVYIESAYRHMRFIDNNTASNIIIWFLETINTSAAKALIKDIKKDDKKALVTMYNIAYTHSTTGLL